MQAVTVQTPGSACAMAEAEHDAAGAPAKST